MALPSFSVVIPCYNYGRFLRRAVESVVYQPDVDLEVIIVDDCSTDESAQTVNALANEYEAVRAIRHERNQGLIATMNDGIDVAGGDYLLILSADDAAAPGALRRVAAAFDRSDAVGLVFGSRDLFRSDEDLPSTDRYVYLATPAEYSQIHIHESDQWMTERCRQGMNLIASPSAYVRMSVQRKVGQYEPTCRHTSDLNMWLRVAAESDVAYVAGGPLAYYRWHGQNMSEIEFGDPLLDLEERWTAYRHAIQTCEATPERKSHWEQIARRSLATESVHEARRQYEHGGSPDTVHGLVDLAREIDPAVWEQARRHRRTAPVRRDALRRLRHRPRVRGWFKRWDEIGL